MFAAESPYRRSNYRPRPLGQAGGIPPGAVPVGPSGPPMPVSAPVGTAPLPAPAPAPMPPVEPVSTSAIPGKLLLGGGVLLGSGVAWLGYRVGSKEKSTLGKVAGFGLGAIGLAKALWDAGTLLGWPADRFPA